MNVQSIQSTNSASAHSIGTAASRRSGPALPLKSFEDTYSGERAERAASIMAGVDLRNISRNELKALTDKLYDAGVITGEQRLDLTAPYVDQLDSHMRSIVNPDQKRNLLAELQTSLDSTKLFLPGDRTSIAFFEKLNNLAQSLASAADPR